MEEPERAGSCCPETLVMMAQSARIAGRKLGMSPECRWRLTYDVPTSTGSKQVSVIGSDRQSGALIQSGEAPDLFTVP